MKKAELLKMAAGLGLKGLSAAKNAEIISAIKAVM